MEYLRIVQDGFDAEYTFAFGIDLQRQIAAMQFEDRQIIRRSLERDLPFRQPTFTFAISGPVRIAQNLSGPFSDPDASGFDRSTPGKSAPFMTDLKNKVPAVLHLVIGVLVMEAAAIPFFGIQSKAEAGAVDPTLADLAQSPYRRLGA